MVHRARHVRTGMPPVVEERLHRCHVRECDRRAREDEHEESQRGRNRQPRAPQHEAGRDEPGERRRQHQRKSGQPAVEPTCLDLEQERIALTAAGADRGETDPATPSSKLCHERNDKTGAASADRMAECDGAAIDIDDGRINAKSSG